MDGTTVETARRGRRAFAVSLSGATPIGIRYRADPPPARYDPARVPGAVLPGIAGAVAGGPVSGLSFGRDVGGFGLDGLAVIRPSSSGEPGEDPTHFAP